MWLGSGLFQDLGWKDDLEGHQRLCHDFAMDIVFLPVSLAHSCNPQFDYRYFSLDEARRLVAESHGLLVSIVIDGPFQRVAQKMGLQSLLRGWWTERTIKVLHEESIQVGKVVTACLECKPDALVIADDIAYHHSTYVSYKDLEQSLFIFYREWVQEAHAGGVLSFFHSDGNLTSIVSGLLVCGFDGLAGCELECQDVPALKRQYGARLTFLTGVPSYLLDEEELGPQHQRQFIGSLTTLASRGRFVLCSSRGLSSAKHLFRLRTLYHWADEVTGLGL